MSLIRRQFLHLAAGATAFSLVARIARAQSYPARPVRLIVADAPGGAPDIVARLIGQWLSERLGQPFIVENRPGAGTTIAMAMVAKAPPDGYTLALVGASSATSMSLYDNLAYDLSRDITPIASIVRGPLVMVVNPSFPAKTVGEFIAYAKANPTMVNMASAGNGTVPHVAWGTIQHVVRLQDDPCALSWWTACVAGRARRTCASLFCRYVVLD